MLKWYGFLILLTAAVAIFVFAPMGLVGHFIGLFTPPGLDWVGKAFALGLSLSIVANAFLSRWKSMRPAFIALIILAISEGIMSGATLYLTARENGKLDAVTGLGILAIVAMQEAVLISGGIGMSLVLDKISERSERKTKRYERRANVAEGWAKMSKRKRIETLWGANPSLTVAELHERTGASKAHVSEVVSELKRNGKPADG